MKSRGTSLHACLRRVFCLLLCHFFASSACAALLSDSILQENELLRKPVTLSIRGAKIRDILKQIQDQTTVPLIAETAVFHDDFPVGNILIAKAPAWKVLEQLRATQLRDGSWKKNDVGYCLCGTRIRTPSAARLDSPSVAPIVPSFFWFYFSAAILGLASLALLIAYFRQRSSGKTLKDAEGSVTGRSS